MQAEITYPNIQMLPHEQGILIIIQHSPLHSEQVIIPPNNADAISAAWLATRPQAVWLEAIKVRKERQKQLQVFTEVAAGRHS